MAQGLTAWYPSDENMKHGTRTYYSVIPKWQWRKYKTWHKNLQCDTPQTNVYTWSYTSETWSSTWPRTHPPEDPRIRVFVHSRDMKQHMNMQKSERLQGCENPCHHKHIAYLWNHSIQPNPSSNTWAKSSSRRVFSRSIWGGGDVGTAGSGSLWKEVMASSISKVCMGIVSKLSTPTKNRKQVRSMNK